MRFARTVILPVVLGAALAAGDPPGGVRPALADDFRVDNAVYLGDQSQPSSESTTIFSGGVVYDCLKTPAETVVLDGKAGRFILLNLTQQTRAELPIGLVAAFTDQLQQVAAKSPNPPTRFLAEPKFQERLDEATGELLLSSPWMSYRLSLWGEASPTLAEQYHESCDWYARLKPMLVPGSPPPFVRLVVDAALAKRQALPSRVVLTVASAKTPKQQTTIRSEHRVVRPLSPDDLQRVADTRRLIESFKLVSFDQYRKSFDQYGKVEPR